MVLAAYTGQDEVVFYPLLPTCTPPPNKKKNLFSQHHIKEKHVEKNLTLSNFYFEVLWLCYKGSQWRNFWWWVPHFVPSCRDY